MLLLVSKIYSRKNTAFIGKMTTQSSPECKALPKPGFSNEEWIQGYLIIDYNLMTIVPAEGPQSPGKASSVNQETALSRIVFKGKVSSVDQEGNAVEIQLASIDQTCDENIAMVFAGQEVNLKNQLLEPGLALGGGTLVDYEITSTT